MATVITSIGSKSTTGDPVNGQMTMTGSSGSGTPWTGNLSVSSAATANVGDMLFLIMHIMVVVDLGAVVADLLI